MEWGILLASPPTPQNKTHSEMRNLADHESHLWMDDVKKRLADKFVATEVEDLRDGIWHVENSTPERDRWIDR